MPQLWWFIPNWLGVVLESAAGIVLAQPSVKRLEVGVFVREKQKYNRPYHGLRRKF